MSADKFPKTKLDRWNEAVAKIRKGKPTRVPAAAVATRQLTSHDEAALAAAIAFAQNHEVRRDKALSLCLGGGLKANRSMMVEIHTLLMVAFVAGALLAPMTELPLIALPLLITAAGLFVSAREAAAAHILRRAFRDPGFRDRVTKAQILIRKEPEREGSKTAPAKGARFDAG